MAAQGPADPRRPLNRLARETSPYLLQHAANPVDWYPWGEEALARARDADLPLLLSVGYSACHWCHVMAHESFEDEAVAVLMNRHFVNVKVDREERPDLDEIYMSAVQLLSGRGGWPMTVFLTPAGEPFFGGTYFPPEDRHGMPSFRTVLLGVSEAWAQHRGELEASATLLVEKIRALGEVGGSQGPVDAGLLRRAYADLQARFDSRWGGFGGAPKFPMSMCLSFCLRRWRSSGDTEALSIAVLSLERMAAGGIHDHLGGGFHRYAVDGRWLVPHFEKMLYDNALLARLYLEGWQATGNESFRRTAEGILGYVRRDLLEPGGGFHASEDADSEGGEGGYYVWTPEQLRDALGPAEAELIARAYGVSEEGNFEGGASVLSLPRPVAEIGAELGLDPQVLAVRLEAARRRLFSARSQRARPARDQKILASWNGLMVDAMAFAARVLGSEADRLAAIATGEFLWRVLCSGGRVRHCCTDGEARIDAFLDDVAALGLAFLSLWETSFDACWLGRAVALAGILETDFEDRQQGGFFFRSAHAPALIARSKNPQDSALPGGNSLAVHFLLRLSALTGEERWERSALRALGVFRDLMARSPMAFAFMLEAAEAVAGGIRQVAIVATEDRAASDALIAVARRGYDPGRVVAVAGPSGVPSEIALLFRDKVAIGGRPTAYLCRRFACERPTTSPEELALQLAGGGSAGPV